MLSLIKNKLSKFVVIGLFLLQSQSVWGAQTTLSTSQIVSQTLSAMSCLQYQVVGICFWLRCTISGCSVETSIKVGHYNPDVVVSSYPNVNSPPWQETMAYTGAALSNSSLFTILGSVNQTQNFVDLTGDGDYGWETETNCNQGSHGNPDFDSLTYLSSDCNFTIPVMTGGASSFPYELQGGVDTNGANGGPKQHVATKYMETDAIGNPAILAMSFLSGTGYVCPSAAIPLYPYFLSVEDAVNWRFASLEMFYPASLVPGMREIGYFPLNTWGAVYPRTGFTTQNEHPKSAAITAQRVGDIVTRSMQPHAYRPIGTDCDGNDMKCFPPPPLEETDEDTGKWQMLKPIAQSSCEVFGQNDTLSVNSWANYKEDEHGDYTWNLWRPYSCCEREGQAFLGSTGSYP